MMDSTNGKMILDCELGAGPGPRDDRCTICISDLLPSETTMIHEICLNSFHDDCLRDWINYGTARAVDATCPMCRRIVGVADETEFDGEDEYNSDDDYYGDDYYSGDDDYNGDDDYDIDNNYNSDDYYNNSDDSNTNSDNTNSNSDDINTNTNSADRNTDNSNTDNSNIDNNGDK